MTRLYGSPTLARFLSAGSLLLLLGGAAGLLAGSLGPWATFRVFHNIEINLPGVVFPWGGLCLTVALLVFLGMRRFPILCLFGALLSLSWTAEAQKRVPERVKYQLAGSQLELSASVNRLLDQFHIPDIEVADLNTPNPNLLGEGLAWTTKGAWLLLLGSVLGLPSDPVFRWVYTRTAHVRCRACGSRRLLARPAQFCPQCGASTLPAYIRLCPYCGTEAQREDKHCVTCGKALAPIPA